MAVDERSDLPVLSRPFYRIVALRLSEVAIGVGPCLTAERAGAGIRRGREREEHSDQTERSKLRGPAVKISRRRRHDQAAFPGFTEPTSRAGSEKRIGTDGSMVAV